MSNFFIAIIVIGILTALSLSVISGIILATEYFDDVKLVIPELNLKISQDSRNDSNSEGLKPDTKALSLNKTDSNQETTIDVKVEKFTTPESKRLRVSGEITNLDPWKKVYITINDLDSGKTVLTHSLSLKGEGHEFGHRYNHGFSYAVDSEQFSSNVLYEVTVSHNDMKVAKTFLVDQLEESIFLPPENPLVNKLGGVVWYGTSYRDGFDALAHLQKEQKISIEKRSRPIDNLTGAGLVFVGPPLNGNQFSESEITELVSYVKNGGRLILAVDNDYAHCKLPITCALEITKEQFGFGFTGNIQSGEVIPAQGKSDHPIWTSPNLITSISKWGEDGYVYTITEPENVDVLARTTGTTKTPGQIHLAHDVAVIVVNENPDFNDGKVLGAGYDMIVDYGEFQMFDNVINFMLPKK